MWTLRASDGPWFVMPMVASVAVPTTMLPATPYRATTRSAIGRFTVRVRVTVSGSGSGCCSGVVDMTVTVAVVLAACAVGVAETATGTEV